jgi:ubiquinone/menaquinone biosynthesis C-methylase UbiE
MFPAYLKPLSRYFREQRNRPLVALIDELARVRGGAIVVVDIGGSIEFWLSVPKAAREKCRITLVNLPGEYATWTEGDLKYESEFMLLEGDARDLSQFADASFDLGVCNSVIEHVGTWADMEAATREIVRVAKHGWVQVPAFEFPLEQHFLVPFVHWFAAPIQRRMLHALHAHFRGRSFANQQSSFEHTRPLTRGELQALLPNARLATEWFVFPKSHIAMW